MVRRTKIQSLVIDALTGHDKPETTRAIALHVSRPAGVVGTAIDTLEREGIIARVNTKGPRGEDVVCWELAR